MRNIGIRLLGACIILSMFTLGLFANQSSSKKDKVKPSELVEKHLQSIGSEQSRSGIKSIMAVGHSKAIFKGRGTGISEGIVVLASQAEKNMIGMKFNNTEYQFEKMGYDGRIFTVGYTRAGKRSVLGSFLRINQKTFKKGLLGGVLSTSWELSDYDEKEGKLKYAGRKKIKDKKVYKFTYNIKSGSDLDVSLYFDAETFRHVKTEYSRVIAASLGDERRDPSIEAAAAAQGSRVNTNTPALEASRVDSSARKSEIRQKLVEEFDDFREENGLILPHSYKIKLEIRTGNGTTIDEWTMNLQRFFFNQQIASSEFRVDSVRKQ